MRISPQSMCLISVQGFSLSCCYASPRAPRCVARVSDWPGQGNEVMSSKIPTIIYYDKNNEV